MDSPLEPHLIRLGLRAHGYNTINAILISCLNGCYGAILLYLLSGLKADGTPASVKWKLWGVIFGYFPRAAETALYIAAASCFLCASFTEAVLRVNSPEWHRIFMRLVPTQMKPCRYHCIARAISRTLHVSSAVIFLLTFICQIILILFNHDLLETLDLFDLPRIFSYSACAAMGIQLIILPSILFTLQSSNLYYRLARIHCYWKNGLGNGGGLSEFETKLSVIWGQLNQCNRIWCKILALFQCMITATISGSIKMMLSDCPLSMKLLAGFGSVGVAFLLVLMSLTAGGMRQTSHKMAHSILKTLSKSRPIAVHLERSRLDGIMRLSVLAHKLHRRPLQFTCWNLFPFDYGALNRTLYYVLAIYVLIPKIQSNKG